MAIRTTVRKKLKNGKIWIQNYIQMNTKKENKRRRLRSRRRQWTTISENLKSCEIGIMSFKKEKCTFCIWKTAPNGHELVWAWPFSKKKSQCEQKNMSFSNISTKKKSTIKWIKNLKWLWNTFKQFWWIGDYISMGRKFCERRMSLNIDTLTDRKHQSLSNKCSNSSFHSILTYECSQDHAHYENKVTVVSPVFLILLGNNLPFVWTVFRIRGCFSCVVHIGFQVLY